MTLNHFPFRPAGEGDEEFLWALRQRTMREYVEPVRGWDEAVEREYAADLEGCWIIEHDSRPCGAFQVKRWPGELHLSRLQIDPPFQGRGWGTQVTRHVQHEMAAPAGMPLTLQVLRHNPARRLYERLGFVAVDQSGELVRMRWQPDTRSTEVP